MSNRIVTQPGASARQLAATGTPLRRLIIRFAPAGGTMRIATAGSAVQANLSAMRRSMATHLASRSVSAIELSPAILSARVSVPEGTSMDDAAAALRADASIASVTPDVIVPMLAPHSARLLEPLKVAGEVAASAMAGAIPGVLPNDQYILPQLWHYNLIDAPRAWKVATGSPNVLVAVIDNGIRYDHPAMGANLTHDGYNFVSGGDRLAAAEPVCQGGTTTQHEAGPGPDPTQPDDFDYFDPNAGCWVRSSAGNHGLHVAGTIGASGNDGLGVTGINWRVNIRPVRGLDVTGGGSYFDIAQAILYAAGLPASDGLGGTVTAPSRAPIINMSLGGSSNDSTLHLAVIAATNAGSLIIASAGNGETFAPSYPAAYAEVLAVSAVGPDLSIASYTNVGGNVSLAAPGGNFRSSNSSGVLSSTWNFNTGQPNYAYYEGTSMAAPHVTGVAALTLTTNTAMTGAQLRARLQATAVHVGAPGRNDQYGYGLVNAYNAVTNTSGPARSTFVRVVNASTGATAQTVQTAADGSYSVSRLPAGSYLVYAGQDEAGDKLIGVPGRKFGWFGGASGPQTVTIGSGTNAVASISVGTPVETKPHDAIANANKLAMNSYIVGQITATDPPGLYSVLIPAAGTYYFEAAGVLGSCGYGIELNTVLELYDANGAGITSNDNAVFPGSVACSAFSLALNPGTYFVRVRGSGSSTGQYRVWVRDQP
jgi:subtilisin family serine protease